MGFATAIPFISTEASALVPILGVAYKYNVDSERQGYSYGLNFVGRWASFGASFQREPSDVLVPDQTS